MVGTWRSWRALKWLEPGGLSTKDKELALYLTPFWTNQALKMNFLKVHQQKAPRMQEPAQQVIPFVLFCQGSTRVDGFLHQEGRLSTRARKKGTPRSALASSATTKLSSNMS